MPFYRALTRASEGLLRKKAIKFEVEVLHTPNRVKAILQSMRARKSLIISEEPRFQESFISLFLQILQARVDRGQSRYALRILDAYQFGETYIC